MVKEKGVLEITDAFKIIKKEIPNAKLIMIGKGILEKTIREKIKSFSFEKDIIMLKNIPEKDLFNYHFSSDIFISGVRTNNLMLSIQEAMACGLPVISSTQPFLVENNINGYVVGINNPKGLADGVIKLYNNSKMKEMGKSSIELVRKYDWEITIKNIIQEYKLLLEIKGDSKNE
jgi:glycosyltransferase involved in cell wall biosynthesis